LKKTQLMLAFFTAVLLLTILPTGYAQGFSSMLDDEILKFSLSYPAEVRIGSCFQLVFEVTALKDNVGIDEIRLTVIFVHDSTSTTLLDKVIASDTTLKKDKDIFSIFSICVPRRVAADPSIFAVLFANYTRDGSDYKPLTNRWLLAIAREKTYDQLAAELDNARRTIRDLRITVAELRDEIDRLRREIHRLENMLEDARLEIARLEEELSNADDRYQQLKQDYEKLSGEYEELSLLYAETTAELKALQESYDRLSGEKDALARDYNNLLRDYRSLTEDYTALQASYNLLKETYDNLSKRHESAVKQIGQLQSQLDDAKQEYRMLLMNYESLNRENALTRSIAFMQAFVLVAVAAIVSAAYYLRRRRTPEAGQQPPQPAEAPKPPATPPSTSVDQAQAEQPGQDQPQQQQEESGKRVQRMLSGRRVTVPSDFVSRLGLREGDQLLVEVKEDYVVIRPFHETRQRQQESGAREDGDEASNTLGPGHGFAS